MQKKTIKPSFKGDLKNFTNWVNIHRLNGLNFKTVQSGGSAYIIHDHFIDFFVEHDKERDSNIPSLCRAVSFDIKKYELKNKKPIVKPTFPIVEANRTVIEKMIVDENFYSIDLAACYWNVARKLGYISENTYLKGLNFKQARLIAIGNLNKTYCNIEYGKGKGRGVKTYEKSEYSSYWHSILTEVENIYYGMTKACGNENYLGFETDCIFIKESALLPVINFLKEFKIEYRSYLCYVLSKSDSEFRFKMIDSNLGTDKILYVNSKIITK